MNLGDLELALQDFEECMRLEPGNPWYHFSRAMARFYQKQYQPAIDDLSWVLDRDRENTEAWFQRGMAYTAMGNEERAKPDFEKSISLGLNRKSVEKLAGEVRGRNRLAERKRSKNEARGQPPPTA